MLNSLDREKPIILPVSETKLNEKFKLALNGYALIRTVRVTDNGGGTGILLRNNIIFEELNQTSINSIEITALKRSIISYGFAAWNNINSFNMEKIRKFE